MTEPERPPDADRAAPAARGPETASRGEAPPSRAGAPGELFLTGGTGLIGSHVAERFRDAGWEVRALVRPDSDTRHLEGIGCRLVLGDVTAPDTLSGAAAGCRAAVHAAAVVVAPAGWGTYREVNVDGTRHVLSEALGSGVRRFVHVSSVAVYGPPARQPRLPVDEEAPADVPLPPGSHYERSKRMAEEVVRRGSTEAIEWTMLRPAVVTGERDRHFTPRVAGLVGDRVLFVTVGDGTNELPVVYAGNVAAACLRAATRPEAAGRVYNLADDGGITQAGLFREAGREEIRLIALPRGMVLGATRLLEKLSGALPGDRAPTFGSRRASFLSHPNPFRSDRIREELGWAPEVPTVEGWRRALDWWRRSA